MTLAPAQLEQLADLIADRLRSSSDAPSTLVGAPELAAQLGVDAKSVYRHADELGAIRVGRRLRFDPEKALTAWGARDSSERPQAANTPAATGRNGVRRRASSASHCQLLPVGRRNGTGSEAR